MASASRDQQRDLIARGLEAEVNKRAAVSLFDRFGPSNPLFKKQYADTRLSLRSYHSCSQTERVRASLELVNLTIETKKKERALLSKLNRGAVARVEKLCDAVADLREEFDLELDSLTAAQDDPVEGGPEPADLADTITEWRAEALPSVPAEDAP